MGRFAPSSLGFYVYLRVYLNLCLGDYFFGSGKVELSNGIAAEAVVTFGIALETVCFC
jgi:hypothetical protein